MSNHIVQTILESKGICTIKLQKKMELLFQKLSMLLKENLALEYIPIFRS